MNRRTWTCKDTSGCEFMATVFIDADYATISTDAVCYHKGDRRYSAFDGKVKATNLDELKAKVAAL